MGFRCPDCVLEIQDRFYSQTKDAYMDPLTQSSSQPYVTYALLGLIGFIFVLMELAGGSTTNEVLISFGANDGSLIINGEIWRLFTSMFLHIGARHLAFNVIGLIAFGLETERIYGNLRYLFIYLLSGLFGSLLSFATQGYEQYSAGASGAIYGVLGMQLAFFWLYRHQTGELGRQRRNMVLVLVGVGFILGYSLMPADNMAHLGGLIAGAILGYLFAPRYRIDHSQTPRRIIDHGSLLQRWWGVVLSVATFAGSLWAAWWFWASGTGMLFALWWYVPNMSLTDLWAEASLTEESVYWADDQPRQKLEYNQPVNGVLGSGEFELWQFSGEAGQIVTLTMDSRLIDSYLTLLGPNDDYLIEDDDSGGHFNALISHYQLPVSGTYTLIAENLNNPGPYRLVVTLENAD